MLCFVASCNHQSLRETCSFFRFPKKSIKIWEKLCRRQDRTVTAADRSRICSCHFKDGKKENGPTIFPWNQGQYFDFGDSNAISRQCKQSPSVNQGEENAVMVEETEAAQPIQSFSEGFDHDQHLLRHGTEMEQQIDKLTSEIAILKTRKQPFTISQIINDEKKMLMYTSLKVDMFRVVDSTIQRFPLT
ncbi:uncharacterized protein LOC134253515 [Saccostrea cucullata]|uniref:uncharacterized protein LOC134253515 n=1 Tax=Saccostrea cuccullata TaxID=36930 RepID=UPI002ED0534F